MLATPSLLDFVAKRTRRRWLESTSSPAWRQVHQRLLLLLPESPVAATARHESVFFKRAETKELETTFQLLEKHP